MDKVREQVSQPPETELYVVDRVFNPLKELGASEGHLNFQVKWFGDDLGVHWQPPPLHSTYVPPTQTSVGFG